MHPRRAARFARLIRLKDILGAGILLLLTTASRADDDAPTPAARLEGGSNTAVAFSRDGSRLLTAGGREARVWDVGTLKPACPPLRHAADVTAAALSPDGRRAATAAGDVAIVWDVATGDRLLTLTYNGRVMDVAFGPDGRWLATACLDRTARVWDAATGDQLLLLRHDDPVRSVSFSPEGLRLLTGTVFPQADPDRNRGEPVDFADPSEYGDAFGWDLADPGAPRWHLAGLG